MSTCDTFWGSHGCDLEPDHEGQHHCLSCCRPDDPDHMAAHQAAAADQYAIRAVGCAGTWPYHGRSTKFFRLDFGRLDFGPLPDEFDRLAGLRVRP